MARRRDDRTLRLGGDGMYDPAAPYSTPAYHAALLFLDVLPKVVPEVLDDLREGVFRWFDEAAHEEMVVRYRARPDHGSLLVVEDLPDRVRHRLEEWADRYTLREHWILDNALRVMFGWQREPDTLHEPTLLSGDFWKQAKDIQWWLEQRATQPPPMLSLPGWCLHVRWDRYEKEALAKLRRQLRAYRDDRLEHNPGWLPMPRKHSLEHFNWLARYQCGHEKQKDIAAEVGVSEQQVSNAINALARLLAEFTLYHGRAAPRTFQRRVTRR